MIPLKPMNAMDISPAVTRAIGNPRRQCGILSLYSMRSRNPAIRNIASKKPTDAPNACTIDWIKE